MQACTQLADGHEYWPLDPTRVIPSPYNIAHKMAQTNRFGGSCLFPYSVAQHSILGAKAILKDGYPSFVALAFLFHDASEPLGFCDLPAPIKYADNQTHEEKEFIRLHKLLEQRILDSLLDHYGVARDKATWEIVSEYDRRIIANEKMNVMAPAMFDWGELPEPLDIEIKPMDWTEARDEWLRMYHYLVWG